MEKNFNEQIGYLPCKEHPKSGDKVILSPTFVFTALIFEHRALSASKFFRRTVLVDASNGRSELTEYISLVPVQYPHVDAFVRLKPKISQNTASYIAKYGTLTYEDTYRGFVLKPWKIFIFSKEVKLMWRLYLLRGDVFIDAFDNRGVSAGKI